MAYTRLVRLEYAFSSTFLALLVFGRQYALEQNLDLHLHHRHYIPTIVKEMVTSAIIGGSEGKEPKMNRAGGTLEIPWTEKYSDMKIYYRGGMGFPAHKLVLCTQSSVIAKAMDGPFREGATHRFKLPDFEGPVVSRACRFMYSGYYSVRKRDMKNLDDPDRKFDVSDLDIQEPAESTSRIVIEILLHASVSCLGDYLDVLPLRKLCNGQDAGSHQKKMV
ncbi:hypothetical protein KEM56_003904 [Ascosphaera pollenicola]|nr:hypothetical protein KEM56_003904 [Ascosphaera pollenicola]